MDLPLYVERYITQSIEHSLGLPISPKTLQLKLLSSERDRDRLQEHVFLLEDKLKEQEKRINQARVCFLSVMAESALTAQVLKKFVEENELLKSECERLEKECTLYDHDRETFMEFGDEADERARENEKRALAAEDQLSRTTAELKFFQRELELLKNLELVVELEKLRKNSDHLRGNLRMAEQEAKTLFEENKQLQEENRLLKQYRKDVQTKETGDGRIGSSSIKGKRKTRAQTHKAIKLADLSVADITRHPLSPLEQNSPEFRINKK